MVDIHSHIIPYIDDGSISFEESIAMMKKSVESGVSVLVATPHSNQRGRYENYMSDELLTQYRELKKLAKDHNIPIRLFFGMEIFVNDYTCQLINHGALIGLNGSKYYLIEFPFGASRRYIEYCYTEILDSGNIPVIAHPERYTCVQENPLIVYDWLKDGVYTQVNKGSIFGIFGERVRRTAYILFKYDLVTCISSDAHSADYRNTDYTNIKNFLVKTYGVMYAKRLLRENAMLILSNKPVPKHGRIEK